MLIGFLVLATSFYKTKKKKEQVGENTKGGSIATKYLSLGENCTSGDWSCHVVFIWKQNYCIADAVGNRLFLALSFHTFAAICQIVETLVLRKSLGKSLNVRAIALSLP